jgi:8-oxo-dGTP pyrophosphatase MutT (NUDIX family)
MLDNESEGNSAKAFIQDLHQIFQQPLPGIEAQREMSPVHRKFLNAPPNARQSATLLLLYQKDNQWYFPLIQRPGNEKDKHSGQISFPGGQVEKQDSDVAFTAKREAFEEIGITISDIEIIGKLSQTYIDVSNFNIHPFVGFLSYPPEYTIQKSEVDQVIDFPVKLLLDSNIRKKKDIQVRNFKLKEVPYFDFQNHVIWGATAIMLQEFSKLLNKVNF